VVSIVIPVWNEEPANLRALHERLQPVLDGLTLPWEVVFVDDGSDGMTREALRELNAQDARLRLIFLDGRHGQETALVTGLLEVKGELVCIMDCDLENRPEDIPKLLAPLNQGYDLVLGMRQGRQGVSWLRQLFSQGFNWMMSVRWGIRISDWGCGFNAGRRSVFERLRGRLGTWADGPLKLGFIHTAERWTEVSVARDPRSSGSSGYSLLRLVRRALTALIHGNAVTPARVAVK